VLVATIVRLLRNNRDVKAGTGMIGPGRLSWLRDAFDGHDAVPYPARTMRKPGKRSPFQRRSLPQAGESLGQEAIDLFFDRFFIYFVCSLALVVVGICELIARWIGGPMSPWHWIIVGSVMGVLALWRGYRIKPQLERIRLGRQGEREVGRMLERLRRDGYDVFHDIPGNGFNVDHVIVGRGGVFAIETKTVSKPTDHDAQIVYDGERVLIDGFTPDRDPIKQSRAGAAHVADILNRMSGRNVEVRSVVLYPGWYVDSSKVRGEPQTWVLNGKAFLNWVGNAPPRLGPEDVALYADRPTVHLSSD
jgi:hypothetical protein